MPILLEQKVSLVILDVKMPYIDGEELLIRIKKEFPLVEVLIVTGIDNIETAVSCIKAGAFNYCVKPVEIHFLLSEINHILKISTLENELQRAGSDVHPGNLKNPGAFSSIMTVSERMNHVFHRVEAIASSSQPLLVTGETGTGKDFIPGILHSISGRNGKLVKVTVSGLDDTMFSDTLFGHTKGAYTGASETRKGLIEQAKDGTLFLDEIGDMPPGSQVKLLHLIQHGEYYKLGSDTLCHSNTRIVAATNADLKEKIARGLFREDLYYRLTYQIHLPPLRDRLHDLPVLTGYFMETAAQDLGKNVPAIPGQLIPLLRTYHFPGNVRELKRMIYEAVSCHTKGKLSITYFKKYIHDHTPHDTQHRREEQQAMDFTLSFPGSFPTLQEVNAKIITHAMEKSSGNQVLAAYLLGMTPSALNKRLKKMYGDDFCQKFKKKTQDFAWNRDNKGESQKGMKRLP
jgi:DNA-binding NtrC family response regulator